MHLSVAVWLIFGFRNSLKRLILLARKTVFGVLYCNTESDFCYKIQFLAIRAFFLKIMLGSRASGICDRIPVYGH